MKAKASFKWTALILTAAVLTGLLLNSSIFASDEVTVIRGSSSPQTLTSGKYIVSQESDSVTYAQGIVISSGETVYIEIPAGVTLVCTGRNAKYKVRSSEWWDDSLCIRSTPGIEVQDGATLHITGEGCLDVTGGDGCIAGDGTTGSGIFMYDFNLGILTSADNESMGPMGGRAGSGGSGAFAPSPAIGGAGGSGAAATGGAGGNADYHSNSYERQGECINGGDGGAGGGMGTVYVEGTVQITAKAGAGDYTVFGKGGKDSSARYAESNYKCHNSFYSFLAQGAPGGGGSASNASAVIGGGGGGGGAGGSGLSGGVRVTKNVGTSRTFEIYGSFTNGSDGTDDKGGNGGTALQPQLSTGSSYPSAGGEGGKKGSNGKGGTLYIAESASVNGISGSALTRADLGAETNKESGQGAEVKLLTRTEVTVNLDDSGYADRDVCICSDELGTISLNKSGNTVGLYYGYVPTGNSEYEIYVDGEASAYMLTADTTQTVTKTLNFYTCEVDVTLDDAVYGSKGDHSVRLMRGTSVRAELTEESAGIFKTILLDDVNGNNTYEVYVDGADYDKTLTTAMGARVTAPFYTMTVNTVLHDGLSQTALGGQSLGLYNGSTYITRMDETASGIYTAVAAGENNEGAIYYTIAVGENRCADTVKAENGAARTVDFYNASIILKDGDANWSGQAVALVGGGTVLNMAEEGTSGVYKRALFGENNTEYTVTVAGVPTTGIIKITDESKRAATVNFFTASVSLTKDGQPWTEGASVMLKKDGKTAYILSRNGDSFTRKGIAAGEYDVYVYGANSDADIKQKVSTSGSSASADYFTLTFHKNVAGKSGGDKTLIYQSGSTPAAASAAYEPGYTFVSWKVASSSSSADYIPEAITSKTDVYASWVSPKVYLGSMVRCDENGTISPSGLYLRFPNISIQGYPAESNVIVTMAVTLENTKLENNTPPDGWSDIGAWDSGTGNGNYIFRYDSTADNGITVAQAQAYLRSLIFSCNSTSGTCSVQMSVYGNTN